MKRIITLFLSCMILMTTASASSLFPSFDSTLGSLSGKAPSYSLFAGVEPTATKEYSFSGPQFDYENVSEASYNAYCKFLIQLGYEITPNDFTYGLEIEEAFTNTIVSNGIITFKCSYVSVLNELTETYELDTEVKLSTKVPSYNYFAHIIPDYLNTVYAADNEPFAVTLDYIRVTQEDFEAYCDYLLQQGYQLIGTDGSDSDQFLTARRIWVLVTNGFASYELFYLPQQTLLLEVFPYDVEFEIFDGYSHP